MVAMSRVVALSLVAVGAIARELENPVGKVISLLDDLNKKVTIEGETEAKAYREYVEWCDDASKNVKYTLQRSEERKEELEAKIGELKAKQQGHTTEIEKLAGNLAKDEKELKDATIINTKETKDFVAAEVELVETVEVIGRAVGLLEKEMAKNPALVQVPTEEVQQTMVALSAVLDAAGFQTTDQTKLRAFLQARDDASNYQAPTVAPYKSQTGGIVELLEDMKDKADEKLSGLRKAQTVSKHNFEMLAQSLNDQVAQANKEMVSGKASRSEAEEAQATAEGDLAENNKQLASAKEDLASTQHSCLEVAADHEATVASRTEELKAIAKAKSILADTTSGAVGQSYSFLQLGGLRTRGDLARSAVVVAVRSLARKHHSQALAQLASKIASVERYQSSNGQDPFVKVKGLIQDMIQKLESKAGEEATKKAYCDEQMSKTQEKKDDLQADVEKMSSKIDQKAAKTAQAKEDVRILQDELAALAKSQAEMDKIRQGQSAAYKQAKADLELGLRGVRDAIRVLSNYYNGESDDASALLQADGRSFLEPPARPETHSKAGGAGGSIVGILEVVEADFAKGLAQEETEEADSQDNYEKTTQENKVSRTAKDQAVKYKTKESKGLDKEISELTNDRKTSQSQLDAVLEYDAQIKKECVAKPETYEDRKANRAAEIEGLKSALNTLESETAFLQRRSSGHRMRGSAARLAASS